MSHFQTHLDNQESIARDNVVQLRKQLEFLKQWNHDCASFFADKHSLTKDQLQKLTDSNDALLIELNKKAREEIDLVAIWTKASKEASFNRHMERFPENLIDKTPKNGTMN